jgi:predicted glycoside hydrolase/deacetylase ChbG (UPF0249 family)
LAKRRILVVNADDFGHSREVNRGIIRAHQHGIVTSASLMVRRPAAAGAAAWARDRTSLSVGLHLDLGEWVFQGGDWHCRYRVVPDDQPSAVTEEIDRQLKAFRRLVGRDPAHLDSHQHVHRQQPVRAILDRAARRLQVPLRAVTSGIAYRGDFYGRTAEGEPLPDAISVEALISLLRGLPAGVSELGCHPGEEGVQDPGYASERARELEALCHPWVRSTVVEEGIELVTFRAERVSALTKDPHG